MPRSRSNLSNSDSDDDGSSTTIVIPAKNEAASIALVLSEIPAELDAQVVVVDNASTDRTAELARNAGAHVVHEDRPGYGRVVLSGAEYLAQFDADILIILDGDYSDYPVLMTDLVQPIVDDTHDVVLSTRLNPLINRDSMPMHVIYGNKVVVALMNFLFAALLFTPKSVLNTRV